jgi:hypothetical protein
VPYAGVVLGQGNADLGAVVAEEAKLDAIGARGEREVRAALVRVGAERERLVRQRRRGHSPGHHGVVRGE